MKPLLLLRSGASAAGEAFGDDVEVCVTHEVVPVADGIAQARRARPDVLVVSSRTTVAILLGAGAGDVLRAPDVLASGSATARALREAGAPNVRVPEVPGAAGILGLLPSDLAARLVLWPRGSDAEPSPLALLEARGARVVAPVVYEKRPLPLDGRLVERLLAGAFSAVGVGSLAALDVVEEACRSSCARLPSMVWGALGPESARGLVARGLPEPVVSATLADLVDTLRTTVRSQNE